MALLEDMHICKCISSISQSRRPKRNLGEGSVGGKDAIRASDDLLE